MGRTKPGNGPAGGSKAAAGRRRGPAATVADDFALSESEEEQDEFKARRDKISLSKKRQPVDSDEEGLDEEVLGLMSDEEDEDEDGDEEGEEDDDGDDDDDDVLIEKALEKGGRMAELAKQAKAIGSKLKMHKKEDEDDEDEEEQQDERWGGNKRKYYDTDTAGMEGSDDEEALQEEEEEVLRLEKEKAGRLKASDFGLDDDAEDEDEGEDEDEDEEEEETMGALAQKKGQAKARSNGHAIEVETVTKELGALSAEQREAALMADAPELLALLQDLSDSLKEVRQRIGPVLHEVRAGGLATADGISYLEAKHILLLQYCTHIVFYILLKAEGRPVKDHPVIARLVELRAYLEKIRPIDKRLQYQVDRLIKAAQVAAKQEQPSRKGAQAEAEADGDADGDALRFGPRRDQLVAKPGAAKAGADKAGTAAAGAEPSGVYRPPRINPVSMEGDVERADMSRNDSRLLKEARRKASRSELVRELAEEVVGAPRELRTEVPGFDSLAAIKHRQKMEARASQEEDMMTRVPLSKEENKKMKQQQRAGMSGKSMLDDFADEVADIVGMSQAPDAGGKGSRLADLLSRQKVSQKFGAEIPRSTAHGGDEDLPRREALHERRMKYDSVAARHAAARDQGSDEDVPDSDFFGSGGGKRGRSKDGEEDEVYQAAAAAAADRKRAKQEKYATPATLPPVADETTAGVRVISKEIERNRGLTPHRRKDLKNPRKKHRIMFEKAQVRRKGAVQDVRGPTGVYGGEATGVKSRVVKSRKLG